MGAGESNPAAKRLSLTGPDAIHEATAAARDFAAAIAMACSDAARLAILVEELVTNLYDHGGLGMEELVEIEFTSASGEVILVVTDCGMPFDPSTGREPVIPARGGGAGLALVKAWASRTDYEWVAGQNRLTVTLPFKNAGS